MCTYGDGNNNILHYTIISWLIAQVFASINISFEFEAKNIVRYIDVQKELKQ